MRVNGIRTMDNQTRVILMNLCFMNLSSSVYEHTIHRSSYL